MLPFSACRRTLPVGGPFRRRIVNGPSRLESPICAPRSIESPRKHSVSELAASTSRWVAPLPRRSHLLYLSLASSGHRDKLATSALTSQRRAQRQTKPIRYSDPRLLGEAADNGQPGPRTMAKRMPNLAGHPPLLRGPAWICRSGAYGAPTAAAICRRGRGTKEINKLLLDTPPEVTCLAGPCEVCEYGVAGGH